MNILDNLNAHLSILKDSNKGWEFFVSLKDYVNFINGSSDFKKITEDLKEPREVLTKERTALENKSVEELTSSLSIIRTIVSKNGLNKNQKISKILSDINNYINPNGGLQISGNVSDNLEHFLFEICQNVPEEERFVLFEQFIDKNPKYNNVYGNFSFSKTIEARRDMDSRIEHRDSHELWSDWLKLDQVPKFIEAYSINGIELAELDCKFGYDLINARSFYDSEPEYNDDRDIKFTKLIPEYRGSLLKVHTFLSLKISQSMKFEKAFPEKTAQSTHDDPESSSIKDGNKALKIRTPQGTKWSDISLRWLNGNDVEITLKKNEGGFKEIRDFKELGFYDYKRKGPNTRWAILERAGQLSAKTISWADFDDQKKIDAFQKQVSLLRHNLRNIFPAVQGSKYDPFVPSSHDKTYSITLNLSAEKVNKMKTVESWRDVLDEKEVQYWETTQKSNLKELRGNNLEE